MAKFPANALQLAIEDSPGSGTYTTLECAREHTLTINNEEVDVTNKDSQQWKEILEGVGLRSVVISVSGISSDEPAYQLVESYVQNFQNMNCRATYSGGKTITGAFNVPSIELGASANAEQTYSLTFNSTGVPVFA